MNRTALALTAMLLVVGVVADAVVGYSPFPGYGAAIGLGGCVALTFLATGLGKAIISRPESHYPLDTSPDVHEDLHHG